MKVLKIPFILVIWVMVWLLLLTPVFAGPPKAVTTEYLKTTAAGFNIDRSSGTVLYYSMTFRIRKNLTAPLYALVQFQNPVNKDNPFIQNGILHPNQKMWSVDSQTFRQIKNKQSYEVLITLYGDKDRKNLIGKHSQQVNFSVPETIAPKLGIELIQ